MDFEVAKKKYAIPVPSDETFYSEEYRNYFKKEYAGEQRGDLEQYRPFQEMYNKSFLATFAKPVNPNAQCRSRKAIVLGGQAGAGKSGLVNYTNSFGKNVNEGYYVIDDDLYRINYPKYNDIMIECPEYITLLTAIGSNAVTPKIMKYASDNGYNFIFDGTMKNTRIFETTKTWEDYDITFRVMATSRIESLISIFERNTFLRRSGCGRPVSVDVHDETYNGLENTVSTIEQALPNAHFEVFVRGENERSLPVRIYSSRQKGLFESAAEAVRTGRERDKKRCLKEEKYLEDRINALEAEGILLSNPERKELEVLKNAIRGELDR